MAAAWADAAEEEAERQAGRFEDHQAAVEATLEVGGLIFGLGPTVRRCGLHGDPTTSGRCRSCDLRAGVVRADGQF